MDKELGTVKGAGMRNGTAEPTALCECELLEQIHEDLENGSRHRHRREIEIICMIFISR